MKEKLTRPASNPFTGSAELMTAAELLRDSLDSEEIDSCVDAVEKGLKRAQGESK